MNLTAVRQVIEVAAAVHENSLLKRFKDYKIAVATRYSTFVIGYLSADRQVRYLKNNNVK